MSSVAKRVVTEIHFFWLCVVIFETIWQIRVFRNGPRWLDDILPGQTFPPISVPSVAMSEKTGVSRGSLEGM